MAATTLRTACNRDCPDACGLLVDVEDGKVRALRGDPEHPVTRGFLCYRTSQFDSRQYAADRLTTPLLRRDGRQVPVSWHEAFDRMAAALRHTLARDGPAGVCSLYTGGSLGILTRLTDWFFRLLGPVTEIEGDICGGAGTAAQEVDFGVSESHDVFDLRHSRAVLLWGKNVGVSNVHLVPLLKECRARGARIVVIDPVPPEAGLPGLPRIAPMPGRDLELALGVGRRLLDLQGGQAVGHVGVDGLTAYAELCRSRSQAEWAALAGVRPEEIDLLADLLHRGPASIQVGWGLQRRRRGGATVRALDALGAVSGNLGVPGGGVSFYYWRRRGFRTELLETGAAPARRLALARLGEELLAAKPPVGFLWMHCTNPVASLPDSQAVARGIESVEFSVAVDTHPTDTTRRATLALPCATMLERGEILGAYGHHWIQLAQPVVAPPPGVRSDLEIVQELAGRMGLGEKLAGSWQEWVERLLRAELRQAGISVQSLERGAMRNPLAEPVLFQDGRVPTPSGRVQLLGASDYEPPEAVEPVASGYPLWLFSSSHRKAQCSQWVGDERELGLLVARLHPAAAAGIADGAPAVLRSPYGELRVIVRHDARMRPDTVLVPKSGAMDHGRAANVLVPARETDLGGGACYLDVKVRLEAR